VTAPAPRNQVRVVIIDDHALFAESLELALNLEGYDVHRVPVPESAAPLSPFVAGLTRIRPKVVLLDLDLGPFGDGMNVVVVTAANDRARWGECLHHGARRVLSKSGPLNDILGTVRRINQGVAVITREEREELIALWQHAGRERAEMQTRLQLLTPREQEVLGQLMGGRTVRDIAVAGVVSEATVRTQVKSILAKLEVSSQLAAVGLANHAGWRPPAG
jgi:two-component system nitrate/nitrite response regulator NarL